MRIKSKIFPVYNISVDACYSSGVHALKDGVSVGLEQDGTTIWSKSREPGRGVRHRIGLFGKI